MDLELIIEHVRSFSGKQRIPLRPLTFLVGENSSGKSTFLAALSCVFDSVNYPLNPAFNNPPYSLGTFDTIATYKAGRYGRDEEFSLGFSVGTSGDKVGREVIATYGSASGNVVPRKVHVRGPSGFLNLSLSGSSISGSLKLGGGDSDAQALEFQADLKQHMHRQRDVRIPLEPILFELINTASKDNSNRGIQEYGRYVTALRQIDPPYGKTYSSAPIRSKPRRTYDELNEDYNPEGDHIPTLLARLLGHEKSSAIGERVYEALIEFGSESGLFKRVEVKRLGKKVSDPFQLQVCVAGPAVNLTDAGYGISQALPIVVQSVLQDTDSALLMQQPEVHLHPRAQAALGTFFCRLISKAKNRLAVIETHSDYLVDRVRQEVATGNIASEKVLILFFHKPGLVTTVHSITLDKLGNVENAPPSYREFFLEEEVSLFDRTTR